MAALKESIINLGEALTGIKPEGHYLYEILKSIGANLTGQEIKGKSYSQIFNDFANKYNSFDLVPYFSTDVLGKATSDLQNNDVKVNGSKITGTLKYVTGYTGFSGKEEEQSGNYICLYTPIHEGEVIKMKYGTAAAKTLDDGIIVLRVVDKTKPLTITVTKNQITSTYVFDLSNVTLQANA